MTARSAIFIGVDLSYATLTFADFSNSDFTGCRFSEAILFNTVLKNAKMIGTHFRETILTGCDCSGAIFTDAHLIDVSIEGAIMPIDMPKIYRSED